MPRPALACLAFSIAAVLLFAPWAVSPPGDTLDDGWRLILDIAYLEGWQFGREIIWPYGPYGFLFDGPDDTLGVHPATWPLSLLILSVLALLWSTALWRIAKVHLSSPATRLVWCVAMLWMSALYLDLFFLSFPLLLLCGATLMPPCREWRALLMALSVATALIGLVKFAFLIAALGVHLLIALHQLYQRQAPLALGVFMLSLLLLWLLAGQSPAAIPAYINTQIELSRGFGAMQLRGPLWHVLLTLTLGVLLCGALIYAARQTRDGRFVLLSAGSALLLFLSMKAGFVRHDQHALIAFGMLGLLTLSSLLPLMAAWQKPYASITLCAALVVSVFTLAQPYWPEARSPLWPFDTLPERAQAAATFVLDPGHYRARYNSRMAKIRADHPLPELPGTVDLYPFQQMLLLAHGHDYQPRPVFQSYSAYMPALLAYNRTHLENPASRPDHLLLRIMPIDGRFFTLPDGLSWPAMLRYYRADSLHGEYLLLHRRDVPAHEATIRLHDTAPLGWNKSYALPDWPAIWAAIDLPLRPLGHALNLAYKLPEVYLWASYSADCSHSTVETYRYRLIPGMAEAGFLLSPTVRSARDFAALAGGDVAALAEKRVCRVWLETSATAKRWLYAAPKLRLGQFLLP